jgi:hypothetical protein
VRLPLGPVRHLGDRGLSFLLEPPRGRGGRQAAGGHLVKAAVSGLELADGNEVSSEPAPGVVTGQRPPGELDHGLQPVDEHRFDQVLPSREPVVEGAVANPGVVEAITTRFGRIDVLEYAPSGLDWLTRQTAIRDADAASFEFPLDLMLRTPVPQIGNVGTAAAAALYLKRDRFDEIVGSTGV